VESEVSSWFCIKSRVTQGWVLSPFEWIILMDFVRRRRVKAMGEHVIKWDSKTFRDLGYTDDLRILCENASKMNEF